MSDQDQSSNSSAESPGLDPLTESSLKGSILDMAIEDEMKRSYLTYAMSVIVSRALPDVRDGLKPSQRRILVAMHDLKLSPHAKYRKCAKIAGDTSGNYHPHGEQVIYPTLVRMAQPWSTRYLLVDGQGNFGSIDPDPPAAMRYTEARMTAAATTMLEDIEKDTVDTVQNYDETRSEPTVLPAGFPNLVANGAQGIAVGMATNLPPNNITEIINSLKYLLDNPECSVSELMFTDEDAPGKSGIQGPDFPTGGIICGHSGIRKAYKTGRGRIILRAKTHTEQVKGHQRIIVDEIPYQVGKERLIERMVDNIRSGRIQGIADIRDESSREGLRVAVDLKRDEDPDVILNQLFKFTPLQTTFSIINIALVNGRPRTLNIKQMLEYYLEHRRIIIRRRTLHLLSKAEQAAHGVAGRVVAVDFIEKIIELIRASESAEEARRRLMAEVVIDAARVAELHGMLAEFLVERDDGRYGLSEKQADGILDMQLRRLTGLERAEILERFGKLMEEIKDYRDILSNPERVTGIIHADLDGIKKKFGDERRTEIGPPIEDIDDLDLIADDTMVVTISRNGFIKREPLDSYRVQGRGGKGLIGQKTDSDDLTESVFVATMHQYILCFTNDGKVHWLMVYKIPRMSRIARGRNLVNLLNLNNDQRVVATVPMRDFEEQASIVLYSKNNFIKKVPLRAYSRPRTSGIITMGVDAGDEVIFATMVRRDENILLCTRYGMTVRIRESAIRDMGRTARGNNGPTLGCGTGGEPDRVVALRVGRPEDMLLTICEKGVGKRTKIDDYRLVASVRAKGVINIRITEKNGPVVDCRVVSENDEVMIASRNGMVIRSKVSNIPEYRRATQGVFVMRLKKNDVVATLARVGEESLEEEEDEILEQDRATRILTQRPAGEQLKTDAVMMEDGGEAMNDDDGGVPDEDDSSGGEEKN